MFYRFRRRFNYGLFAYRVRQIHKSPPIACDPAAPCEVHTMLSAEDVNLYLLAIKSLLRFYPTLAVSIYSDGSVDERCSALIRAHVPGCRVISAAEADERALQLIGKDSFMSRWRAHDISWRRIVDTELWSRAPKRIIMDSDILVLNRPVNLIEWIQHGTKPFLMGQPLNAPQSGTAASAPDPLQSNFIQNLPALSNSLGFPNRFLDGSTGGFYGCFGELSLDRVESVIRKSSELGLPMKEWGSEQCTVIYLLSIAGAERLDPERYLNFEPAYLRMATTAEILHFYGTYRFYKNVYPRLASQVATRLGAAFTAVS